MATNYVSAWPVPSQDKTRRVTMGIVSPAIKLMLWKWNSVKLRWGVTLLMTHYVRTRIMVIRELRVESSPP
jgi:hypothetical protein